jgi:DNA-binding response OmpR family regulator
LPPGLQFQSAIVAASDTDWRNYFRQTVTQWGFQPLVSRTGREAVDRARSTTVRLVILGMLMPNISAAHACVHIRGLRSYVATPIIICILGDDPEIRAAAMRAGASLVLKFPLSTFELTQEIFPLLGQTAEAPHAAAEWQRFQEPSPLFGEPKVLAQGRQALNRERQSYSPRRMNWQS